jgi:hypothetical protein
MQAGPSTTFLTTVAIGVIQSNVLAASAMWSSTALPPSNGYSGHKYRTGVLPCQDGSAVGPSFERQSTSASAGRAAGVSGVRIGAVNGLAWGHGCG